MSRSAIVRSRRRFGQAMITIGVLGVIAGIATMIVGIHMVGEVEHSVDDSLATTDEALSVVADSVQLSGTIVDTVQSGLTSVTSTFTVLQNAITQGNRVITDSSGFLGTSLPDALDAVNAVLPTIQDVASSIEDALRALSSIPFGPDYNPQVPFDDAVAQLAAAMAPIPGQLRTVVAGFTGLTTSATDIQTQLETVGASLDQLDSDLGDVQKLIARYQVTASEARGRVVQSRHDLAGSSDSMRLLLVLLGIVIALGQIVPLWLGFDLVRGGRLRTEP